MRESACPLKSLLDDCAEGPAFVTDNSLEGLLTAVFDAFASYCGPCDILRHSGLQARLGQEVIEPPIDILKAERVRLGICERLGVDVFEAVKSTSLHDDPHIGTVIYRFLRYAFFKADVQDGKRTPDACPRCPHRQAERARAASCVKRGGRPLDDIAHPLVAPFIEANRRVFCEREKALQFLRFQHLEGDVWFARIRPNASVVPLIMDWFAGRFNTQPFLIYDEAHQLAGVYEGKGWYLVATDQLQVPPPAADEAVMSQAWKRFYRTIAVEARYNPELRRSFMPKRLWGTITEMQEDLPPRPEALAKT